MGSAPSSTNNPNPQTSPSASHGQRYSLVCVFQQLSKEQNDRQERNDPRHPPLPLHI
jgi:hypothetical protein